MLAGFLILDDIDSDGMLDMVQGLNPISAKPQAHEISAGFEKDFAEKETGTPLLASVQANELSLLSAVRIDHAKAVHVIENDRHIAINKTAHALKFYVDSEIAAWVRSPQLLSVRAKRLHSD